MQRKKFLTLILPLILICFLLIFSNSSLIVIDKNFFHKNVSSIKSSNSNIASLEWNKTYFYDECDVEDIKTTFSGDIITLFTHQVGTGDKTLGLLITDSQGIKKKYLTYSIINEDVLGRGIVLDSEGNIFVLVYLSQQNNIVLLKYNSSFEYQWAKAIEIEAYIHGLFFQINSENILYISGKTLGGENIFLSKCDSSGNLLLYKSYDNMGEWVYDLYIDSNDSIYILSSKDLNSFITKLDKNGDPRWVVETEGKFNCISSDFSGNIFTGGYKIINNYNQYIIMKIDLTGNIVWKNLGGDKLNDWCVDIIIDSIDNIYLCIQYGDDFSEYIITKCYSSNGDFQWSKSWHSQDYIGISNAIYTFDPKEDLIIVTDSRNGDFLTLIKYNTIFEMKVRMPNEGCYYGVFPPEYEISVLGGLINTVWYTINNNYTKIFIEELSGSIKENEWIKYNESSIKLAFYAEEEDGETILNENLTIKKDLTPPKSELEYTPYDKAYEISDNTKITINSDDNNGSGVLYIYYFINHSKYIGWQNYTEPFKLKGFTEGYYKVIFYAVDKVGNIESLKSRDLYVIPSQNISGYELWLLLFGIIISFIYLIKINKIIDIKKK